jgi:hypothetical protein
MNGGKVLSGESLCQSLPIIQMVSIESDLGDVLFGMFEKTISLKWVVWVMSIGLSCGKLTRLSAHPSICSSLLPGQLSSAPLSDRG